MTATETPDTPIAKIYGQPLEHMPKNLFIPPDALAIMLDSFEGPLDLLWYLIRHHKLDICDIPMAPLTEQYLLYIDALKTHTLELAAEYLFMAAWLVEIKSRMLLPQPISQESQTDTEEDPRAALVARLVEYERIRLGAEALFQFPKKGESFEIACVSSPPTQSLLPKVEAQHLFQAWQGLLERQTEPVKHIIEREEIALRDVMTSVLRDLPNEGEIGWESLLTQWSKEPMYVVSVMLALLQLMRERAVFGKQERPLGPWWVARHPFSHTEKGHSHEPSGASL